MTLNELAFNILNKMRGGRSSNNDYISLDQIKFNINYYRSLILHRDLRRSQNKHLFEQDISTTLEGDDIFGLKIVNPLPQLIQLDYEYPIRVTDSEGNVYPVENYHRFNFAGYSKHTANLTRIYIKNTMLFIQSETDFANGDTINISAIFENPSDAYVYSGIDPIEADNQPYPVSGDLAQRISQSLINGDLEIILQTPNDITADNLSPGPKE